MSFKSKHLSNYPDSAYMDVAVWAVPVIQEYMKIRSNDFLDETMAYGIGNYLFDRIREVPQFTRGKVKGLMFEQFQPSAKLEHDDTGHPAVVIYSGHVVIATLS